MNADHASKIERLKRLAEDRKRAGVYPSESDQRFFDRCPQVNGRPRLWHVRRAEKFDDYRFVLGIESENEYITLTHRMGFTHCVLPAAIDTFGPVVNSDAYASFRLQAEHSPEQQQEAVA